MEEDPTLDVEGHQNQKSNENNSWVDELQTQPQSSSSSERSIEQNDRAPPHTSAGDEVQYKQRVDIIDNFAETVLQELWHDVLAELDEVPTPNATQLVAEGEEIARQGYLLAAEGYKFAHVGENLEAGDAQGEQLAV